MALAVPCPNCGADMPETVSLGHDYTYDTDIATTQAFCHCCGYVCTTRTPIKWGESEARLPLAAKPTIAQRFDRIQDQIRRIRNLLAQLNGEP